MEEKIRELLECYHLEIRRLYRGRVAWLCDTEQGLKLFRVYHGSAKASSMGNDGESLSQRTRIYIHRSVRCKSGGEFFDAG